jgi:hypothetical protein
MISETGVSPVAKAAGGSASPASGIRVAISDISENVATCNGWQLRNNMCGWQGNSGNEQCVLSVTIPIPALCSKQATCKSVLNVKH